MSAFNAVFDSPRQFGCTIATVGEETLSAAGPPSEMLPSAAPGPPSEVFLVPGSEPPAAGRAST